MFIESDKENPHKGYLRRGLVCTDLADYKKVNELKPMNAHYQYCLSRAEANIGRENDANNALKTLTDSTPPVSFEGHYYCGVALDGSEKHAAAWQDFEKAFRCHPTKQQSVETHFYTGLTYYSVEEISKAKEEIKQTLKTNEKHGQALFSFS